MNDTIIQYKKKRHIVTPAWTPGALPIFECDVIYFMAVGHVPLCNYWLQPVLSHPYHVPQNGFLVYL